MEDSPQPIIIKRIVAGHGHHGGGWKVAFADFATAMMAFFLLMWLMGSTSAEQKGGISQYFKNPSVAQGVSTTPSPTAVQGPGGPSSAMIDLGGSTERFKNPEPAKVEDDTNQDPTKEDAGKIAERVETQRLENLKEELDKAIDEESSLKPFKDQIMMDLTPEGLRIQIVDKENRSMFDLGGASLKDYSLSVLLELAKAIQKVPNRVSISGHTDQSKYVRQNYGNWELSVDRANAARRALIAGGLPEDKIGRVVGLASSALLDANNPQNPINRRISIIVMNARTEQAIKQESASLFSVQDSSSSSATTNPAPTASLVVPNTVESNTPPTAAPAATPAAAAPPVAANKPIASTQPAAAQPVTPAQPTASTPRPAAAPAPTAAPAPIAMTKPINLPTIGPAPPGK
ncbi:MAG: flagellar motor protein MotB [Steroidobacteraceae bacterium]